MKIAIIGHRGSGKTTFAKRLSTYLDLSCFDLDKEMDEDTSSLFDKLGEKKFRQLEIKTFQRIYSDNNDFIVSLGAGFEGDIPEDVFVYWLKRASDNWGRIFLDRPRLENNKEPLEEFFIRKNLRDERFNKRYDDIAYIPEGFDQIREEEKNFFLNKTKLGGFSLTIRPEIFENKKRKEHFFFSRLKWGLDYFEIRDDLLDEKSIIESLEALPQEKVLLSFRKNPENKLFLDYLKKHPSTRWDWAYELGKASFSKEYDIYSIHDLDINKAIQQANNIKAKSFKLAPLIHNLSQLQVGHDWLLQNKDSAFLPRSKNGRWKWYRIHSRKKQTINFLADQIENAADQPWPLDILYQYQNTSNKFAAVLGKPVAHSFSPMKHYDFFKEYKIPFYAVELDSIQELPFLKTLGLKFAAITSPLKKDILPFLDEISEEAKKLESVNTIALEKDKCIGHNTDYFGLKEFLKNIELPCVLWGGGALVKAIKDIHPKISAYSFRQGKPREGEDKISNPKSLIWAVSRKLYESSEANWPPKDWKPNKIFDLHYTYDSPGVEYAQRKACQYVSGTELFNAQARKQQDFWSQYVGK